MVVVIESDRQCAAELSSVLEKAQIATTPVNNARELPTIQLDNTRLVILGLGNSETETGQLMQILAPRIAAGLSILLLCHPHEATRAAQLLNAGASDYLLYPFNPHQLIARVEQLLIGLEQESMVMRAPASRRLLALANRVASTDATVLITGESGTGKERLARYIHNQSARAKADFVAINCAAIPESMLEAMLFGYVKGAFTGAYNGQAGKFELANGGSLFLDEITEMSPGLQAKLLRVLQEREVERLGSHKLIPLDVRIIAATNQDLHQAVREGRFREDLLYRLDVLPLHLPPLRERLEDIEPLVRHFLRKHQALVPDSGFELTPNAQAALLTHPWSGNIRELENRVQRALVLCRGRQLLAIDFGLNPIENPPTPLGISSEKRSLSDYRKEGECRHVFEVLQRFSGNRTETAAALGITTRALRYKLNQLKQLYPEWKLPAPHSRKS